MSDDNKKQPPNQNGPGETPSAKPKPPAHEQREDQPLKQVNED